MNKVIKLLSLLILIAFNAYVVDANTLNATRLEQMGIKKEAKDITIKSYSTKDIDKDTFKEYTKLQNVKLALYSLAKLDLSIFKNSPNIISICLITPLLTQLTNSEKITFSNLQILEMDDENSLRNLDQDVLNGIPNAIKLSFDYSYELSPLKPNQLTSLKKLQYLKLYTKNQNNITKAHFNGLTSLIYLRFLSSNIQKIDNDTFSGLTSLTYLELTNNSLTSWDNVQIPSNLVTLILSQNNMNSFRVSRTMNVIKLLDLSNNRFSSFRTIDFSILSNLTKLILSNNPHVNQSEIASYLRPLVKLEDVRLRNLSIRSFDSSLFKFNPILDEIDLSFNNITILDNRSFAGLDRLTQVDFSYNRITKIGPNTFDNSVIGLFNLTNNLLTEIDDATFFEKGSFYYVYLSGNLLSKIGSRAFNDMTSLRNISLDRNQLTSLNSSLFAGCKKLKSIDLSKNPNLSTSNLQSLCPSSQCKVTA